MVEVILLSFVQVQYTVVRLRLMFLLIISRVSFIYVLRLDPQRFLLPV